MKVLEWCVDVDGVTDHWNLSGPRISRIAEQLSLAPPELIKGRSEWVTCTFFVPPHIDFAKDAEARLWRQSSDDACWLECAQSRITTIIYLNTVDLELCVLTPQGISRHATVRGLVVCFPSCWLHWVHAPRGFSGRRRRRCIAMISRWRETAAATEPEQ